MPLTSEREIAFDSGMWLTYPSQRIKHLVQALEL